MNQEQIVDNIILNDLDVKYPGCKEEILRGTSKSSKRLAMLSILDDNRRLLEEYKDLINKESYCSEYADEVVVLLREYVKVAETEVKEFGEVMTSLDLVEDILNKFPKEVWSNPNLKWLDPANGVGTFPSIVIKKLMVGLKEIIEDDCQRYKHIIENMIYVCEIQPKNMFLFHCGFDREDQYELNTFFGSYLDDEFDKYKKEVWGIDEFDVILGNPPFQKTLETKNKSVDTLWSKFIYKASTMLSENGILSMICPDGWCSPTFDIPRKEVSIFKDIFKKNNLTYVATNDVVKPFFKNIGTSFTYFVLQKSEYNGETIFETNKGIVKVNVQEHNFIPKNIDKISFSIHEKILKNGNKFVFERYRKKDGGMLDDRHPFFTTPKVKFSRGLAKFKVSGDNGTSGYDVFTYAYHLKDGETIESALSVLNSKPYYFILNQKWNQYFTKYIPNEVFKPILNKIYSDEEIYEYLELTTEEIKYIENNL
jgi:hypothetical protein